MIYFLLEPHESLNEDIFIISDNYNDALDEDKEEELAIYFFSSLLSHFYRTLGVILFKYEIFTYL